MNAYYFRRDKTVVLGAIKVQLLFSEAKFQLLKSSNKTIPYKFLSFEFSATASEKIK